MKGKSKWIGVSVILITAIAMWTAAGAGPTQLSQLMAKSVNVGPTVDGVAEGLWAEVPEVSVSTAVGANAGTHQVTIKSVYTSSDIYFLVQ